MRTLFLDCFSGISGDMTVGALCDLGVKPSTFEWELSKLELGDFHMHFERAKRQSVEGVKFGIHAGAIHTHDQDEAPDEHGQIHAHAHDHDHEHDHGHEHEHEEGDAHHHGHEHAHHHNAEEEGHEHTHGCGHEHAHEHEHEHEPAYAHGHAHEHDADHNDHEAGGRSYSEIRELIEKSDLSDFVKTHALSIFHRIASAEAKIHGTPIKAIGFHEVGALDSIADIVCACVGIEELGVDRICASGLANGHGWVDCAHGRFPIPAMATLEILKGIPVAQIDEPHEFITPTGAAIVAEFAADFGMMPQLRVEKIGYGLGSRQLESRPNVLRAVLGESAGHAAGESRYATDVVTQLETNLDDVSPEIVGALVERLLKAGALDAFLIPVQMKKSRPGVLLTVLCEPAAATSLADLIFAESTAFGLRMSDKPRLKLERRSEMVATDYGEVSVKLGSDRTGRLLQVAPEFDSCRAVAERSGQPVRTIYAAALQAYSALGT